MTRPSFRGVFTALVTPFRRGAVDEAAFVALVERQIAAGVHGLVPVGTTGEGSTLSHAEHRRVIELCVRTAAGRVPVIAGAGSNSTSESIELARHAKAIGADAVLAVTGYYNRPNQEGIFRHFEALSGAVDLPVLVYNIPGRAVVDINDETMRRLSGLANVVGVKDATGDIGRASVQRLSCGDDWIMLSGNDDSALGYMAHGGHGCISVTANVAPRLCAEFQACCLKGDFAGALQYQDKLMPLHSALFIESNPAPVKYALSVIGKCAETVRLPMVPVAEKTRAAVRDAMVHAGLIN